MMNGPEKSDSAIVATKPANKAGRPAAEWVEPRAGTKGNTGQSHTRRTQSRGSVSQGLDRVRNAARQRNNANCAFMRTTARATAGTTRPPRACGGA
jgi:RNA-directed DNA polymerase